MMTNRMMGTTAAHDAELVQAALAGDREAFGQIVARYQALVCTVTYSATGNLGQSEDLAQETFVTAWNKLAELREPAKLRSWLCGIARNLVNNWLRKQQREPSHAAASIEEVAESHSPEPQPVEQTISNEEQAILWRSLEKIPETYREPLVLFYREHQSVETVAEQLELTPDTVHQRLSRGRKLLAEEVLAFVEGALERTNPGQAFTVAVLAALPATLATSAKAATVAAAAKGGASATGTSLGSLLGASLGPAVGFLFAFIGWRQAYKAAKSTRERALIKRSGIFLVICGVLLFVACGWFSDNFAPRFWKTHPIVMLVIGWVIMLSWGALIGIGSWRMSRKLRLLRDEERRLHPELFREELRPAWEYRSRVTLFGLPLVHLRPIGGARTAEGKVQPAVGWIAIGDRAFGIIYASGLISVGGISNGVMSIGLIALGPFGIGLLALAAFALGGIAIGGAAVGVVASGGMAIGWQAAEGGFAAARQLALGSAALGNHANDAVAREFFNNHSWLNIAQPGHWNWFWVLYFIPLFLQMTISVWLGKRMEKKHAAKLY